jgi:hypothetical protein
VPVVYRNPDFFSNVVSVVRTLTKFNNCKGKRYNQVSNVLFRSRLGDVKGFRIESQADAREAFICCGRRVGIESVNITFDDVFRGACILNLHSSKRDALFIQFIKN